MSEIKRIALYFYVCERYEAELKYPCQRFSNNDAPAFTDHEVLTLYLYLHSEEHRLKIKEMHRFAQRYLLSWFPHLPSYSAFNSRLNRLCMAMQKLCSELLGQNAPADCSRESSLVDALPIMTYSAAMGKAKWLHNPPAKGSCATKDLYYYGVKLHALSWSRPGKLPYPQRLVVSSAAENDLSVFKENWSQVGRRTF